MRFTKTYIANLKGIIKDSCICVLLFTLFYFIDLQPALFISIICFSIFLTRRIILHLNPEAIKGHKIYFKDKELSVPRGMDVFDVGVPSSIGNLYKYAEIIRSILVPPRIMIIRFNNKFRISRLEIKTLNQIIKRLETRKILIIFSDINVNMQQQFRKNSIAEKIREENMFYYIKDALKYANKVLN